MLSWGTKEKVNLDRWGVTVSDNIMLRSCIAIRHCVADKTASVHGCKYGTSAPVICKRLLGKLLLEMLMPCAVMQRRVMLTLCSTAPAELQAHAPAPLCHEVLKQHTQMNEPHCSNAALVEQIQALTATHQQLAIQMQALIKVVGDQHTAATTHDSASSFVTAATFAMCVAFGAIIARSFM